MFGTFYQPPRSQQSGGGLIRSPGGEVLALPQPDPNVEEGQTYRSLVGGGSGSGINSATVDSTSTLSPGDPATASVTKDGTELKFTFGIPKGDKGDTGDPGPPYVPTGFSGSVNVITGVDFGAETVTEVTMSFSDGICTGVA